jgi:glycine/D-amino acid oxidase-like deaminating enzyme
LVRIELNKYSAGGGLLGLSTAYYLSRSKKLKIMLVEKKGSLMDLTSNASTGGFRNFYPDSMPMTELSNDSSKVPT